MVKWLRSRPPISWIDGGPSSNLGWRTYFYHFYFIYSFFVYFDSALSLGFFSIFISIFTVLIEPLVFGLEFLYLVVKNTEYASRWNLFSHQANIAVYPVVIRDIIIISISIDS